MKTKIQLTKESAYSYKIGVNEIVGLKDAMTQVMTPVMAVIQDKIYWSTLELDSVEYKSRDGFIAHSHNCGGIEFSLVVPKCEESGFDFLEFGEHDDDCALNTDTQLMSEGTCGESDGLLDSLLRIRLKFEGLDDEGNLNFYLFCEGGNYDAPYFRNLPTIFEAEFSCKSVTGLKRAAAKHIKSLIEVIK